MSNKEFPYEMKYYLTLLKKELKDRKAHYMGDMSDFGNEIGYCIGKVMLDMNEKEINEFVIGLRHGISLTNETH